MRISRPLAASAVGLATVAALALVAAIPASSGPIADPVVVDDGFDVVAGTTFTLAAPGVLANDENIAAGAVVQWQTSPPEGLTLNADGSIDYVVPVDASGTATFRYCILDLPGSPQARCISNLATVTVNIASPVVVDDSIDVLAGTTFTLAAPGVLANDQNIAPGAIVQWQTTPPEGLTLNHDGSIDYVVPVDASGTATFRYCILDLPGSPLARCISNLATVSLTVVTELPVALRDDEYSVVAGEVLQVDDPGVLENDDLPVGYDLAVGCDQPDNAELVCNEGGGLTLTPDDGFTGDITFTYGVTAQTALTAESSRATADRATVTVHVTAPGSTESPGDEEPGDDDGPSDESGSDESGSDESGSDEDGADEGAGPSGEESGDDNGTDSGGDDSSDEAGTDGTSSGTDEGSSDDDGGLPDTGAALSLWLLVGLGLVGASVLFAAGRRRLS